MKEFAMSRLQEIVNLTAEKMKQLKRVVMPWNQ